MGKRSDFIRRASDKYLTPFKAVAPIIPFVQHVKTFTEPCAGDGRLVRHFEHFGKRAKRFFDLTPDSLFVARGDALAETYEDVDAVFTNPPWSRPILHAMIVHFVENSKEAWLLFDADWAHTKQSKPFMKWCTDIVPIGRQIWIDETTMAGKDNAAWYRFTRESDGVTRFHEYAR
ncbi:putative DNA methyltransferase protein [Rhizobium phage RHph_Y5A]|nr:putative DNA methyltransferase protein [Rhizobium phage RHph_Y5A]QIG75550.1 putative DNA methyltransferase protein [Rhizobium phage RHph_Y2_4]